MSAIKGRQNGLTYENVLVTVSRILSQVVTSPLPLHLSLSSESHSGSWCLLEGAPLLIPLLPSGWGSDICLLTLSEYQNIRCQEYQNNILTNNSVADPSLCFINIIMFRCCKFEYGTPKYAWTMHGMYIYGSLSDRHR